MTFCSVMLPRTLNRRSSHGHRGSKRRELAQHAHSRGSYAFTHTLYINTVVLGGSGSRLVVLDGSGSRPFNLGESGSLLLILGGGIGHDFCPW